MGRIVCLKGFYQNFKKYSVDGLMILLFALCGVEYNDYFNKYHILRLPYI